MFYTAKLRPIREANQRNKIHPVASDHKSTQISNARATTLKPPKYIPLEPTTNAYCKAKPHRWALPNQTNTTIRRPFSTSINKASSTNRCLPLTSQPRSSARTFSFRTHPPSLPFAALGNPLRHFLFQFYVFFPFDLAIGQSRDLIRLFHLNNRFCYLLFSGATRLAFGIPEQVSQCLAGTFWFKACTYFHFKPTLKTAS